jgi:2-phosphosulfolactate phosphatase
MNPTLETHLDVLFTPADFAALINRDLRDTTCVVFDVLRASSSMITALANGAEAIIPVEDIPEALALRARDPHVLLAGEREGLRIQANLTGSISFDLGNSPREFTAEAVRGKRIVMTTTNGTRALRACANAARVLVGSFLNLSSVSRTLEKNLPNRLLIVCSGTFEEAAYEDVLGAGALVSALWAHYVSGKVTDSAWMARSLYRAAASDLGGAFAQARNGKRLLSRAELREDVSYCAQLNLLEVVAELCEKREIRVL